MCRAVSTSAARLWGHASSVSATRGANAVSTQFDPRGPLAKLLPLRPWTVKGKLAAAVRSPVKLDEERLLGPPRRARLPSGHAEHLEPEWVERDQPPIVGRAARVGAQAGAERLGATLYEIDPGGVGSPFHIHHANEEMIIVLAGRPTLRTSEGTRARAR